jgi:FAD binding domain
LNATRAIACPPKPDCLIPKPALEALISILGDRPPFGLAEREQHGRGESYHATVPPDAVCYALSTEEVSPIVHVCAAHRVAIIPFGAGTSLEGHVAALKGGLCIDLSRMTRIIAVHFDPGGESTSHPRLRHQCGPLRDGRTSSRSSRSLLTARLFGGQAAPASPRLVMISLASSWDRRGRWGLYHFSI